MHHRASRRRAASSSSGSPFSTISSGTSDCACATVMPARKAQPFRRFVHACQLRRWPCMMAVTSGLSRDGMPDAFRRSRSVGQRGRKSEMTLRITCLHDPCMRLATPDPQQFDAPVLALESVKSRRWRRDVGLPASARRRRLLRLRGLSRPSFASAGSRRRSRPIHPRRAATDARYSAPRRVTSPTTPASPLQRSPSSIAGSTSRSFDVSQ